MSERIAEKSKKRAAHGGKKRRLKFYLRILSSRGVLILQRSASISVLKNYRKP